MVAYMEHKNLANEHISSERAQEITDGVRRVQDQLAQAEAAAGRSEGSVRLLAATKTRDVGEIAAALDAGVRLIGENRPQEVVAKFEGLARQCAQRNLIIGDWVDDKPVPGSLSCVGFHLIGQLQSNKIGKVIPYTDTIESVDSLELAQKIARRALAQGKTTGVLLEVNESGEEAKSGCAPEQAADVAYQIGELEGLSLRGLMTVGAHVNEERVIRAGFSHLRELRDEIQSSRQSGTANCHELSMGMSQDLAYAVAEGSTIVRVGTAIFGERAFM
ncbi:YggS family pyridoxal phosphate enzyme [Bombiscardovia apis]|uniref:Pyridoxal phosphate homeostasis protein n=1 Tax=Bombiscardovia apis TaxID=2932182 RepID=A0ABM8BEF2_9BIFI|nr:YggS family pyridoxal phosphate-dependent enzyme [Bombiscardovia apis]BDR55310.1 YggS family pyridoxal phosphate enzyme [Bombiscardovia apis]